jgi:RND family efflux transporter MFP subunit
MVQDNTVLRAPTGGTITAHWAESGDIANPGQKILTMAASGGLEGVFNAPDDVDLESFLGSAVTMTPIDQPDLTLTGTITQISPLVDARTGAVVVKARLDADAPSGVVFGTAVVGRLNVPQPAAITLPWTALGSASGHAAVWIVDPAALTVLQVPVTVSAYGGDTITLSGGVRAGDIVVTDGSQLLFPGRSVALMEKGQ